MAAVTQAVAFSTGRDFLFGLIPAFDPAGSRNVVAWLSSMLFGACAALMHLASKCCQARGTAASGWDAVAMALALCSMAGMTGVAGLLPDGVVAPDYQRPALTATALAVAAVMLAMTWSDQAAPVRGVAWAGLGLVAVSHFAPASSSTPVAATLALLGRVLQWTGTLLLLSASVAIAFAGPTLVVQIVTASGRCLRVRHDENVTRVTVNPVAVATTLACCVVLLASVSVAVAWPASGSGGGERWYRFFFVDFEGNAPSWFSALLLLGCGVVAAGIAGVTRSRAENDWGKWALVALGFVAMSADEAASFHELLVVPLRTLVDGHPWLRYPLILPGTLAVLAAAVVFGPFVLRLPVSTYRPIAWGGAIFVFGALGLETVGGWYDPQVHGESATYVLLVTVEEVCEMAGATLGLAGLLAHFEYYVGALELRTDEPATTAGPPSPQSASASPRASSGARSPAGP